MTQGADGPLLSLHEQDEFGSTLLYAPSRIGIKTLDILFNLVDLAGLLKSTLSDLALAGTSGADHGPRSKKNQQQRAFGDSQETVASVVS